MKCLHSAGCFLQAHYIKPNDILRSRHFPTIFSKSFSSIKTIGFWFKFHWKIFPMVQLTIIQHWFRQWLGTDQPTGHYLKQWWLSYRRRYASLGLNNLNQKCKLDLWKLKSEYSKRRIRRSHYLPSGSLHALWAFEPLSCCHVPYAPNPKT